MRVVPIAAHNPGPWTGTGSWTYLLPGAGPTLVDAGSGEPRHLDDLAAALEATTSSPDALAQVLVTHAHPDHAGGAPPLAARWPGASFAKRPWPDRDQRFAVAWQALADDQLVVAGDVSLWVLHTPGHAPDHEIGRAHV